MVYIAFPVGRNSERLARRILNMHPTLGPVQVTARFGERIIIYDIQFTLPGRQPLIEVSTSIRLILLPVEPITIECHSGGNHGRVLVEDLVESFTLNLTKTKLRLLVTFGVYLSVWTRSLVRSWGHSFAIWNAADVTTHWGKNIVCGNRA